MSSIIKVNTFQDANGNALFSSDGSGNVTTSASGLQNTPMFHVYLNGHQTVSNNTFTKFQGNVVVKDTASAYSTSNYRWTCPSGQAGTYLFWWRLFCHFNGNTLNATNCILKKNGTTVTGTDNGDGNDDSGNDQTKVSVSGNFIVDVADGDYMELFGYATTSNSGTFYFIDKSYGWGGMKLIGA